MANFLQKVKESLVQLALTTFFGLILVYLKTPIRRYSDYANFRTCSYQKYVLGIFNFSSDRIFFALPLAGD